MLARFFPNKAVSRWTKTREVPPPHPVKQQIVRSFGLLYGLRVLVETGTYLGTMIDAQKEYFDEIYSIELSKDLYERAKRKFKQPHIHLMQGDSGELLGNIELNKPALFWLDGHYSGGVTALGSTVSPIFEELGHIKKSPHRNVVLIDDARLFDGGDYPTIDDVLDL